MVYRWTKLDLLYSTIRCILTGMVSKTKEQIRMYLLLGILYLSGPVFLLLTNPHNLPLPILILPFLWLFCVLFISTTLLLKARGVGQRKRAIVAGVIATIPVLLAIFQSIHQLSIKDVLLSLSVVVLAAWYVMKADFIR